MLGVEGLEIRGCGIVALLRDRDRPLNCGLSLCRHLIQKVRQRFSVLRSSIGDARERLFLLIGSAAELPRAQSMVKAVGAAAEIVQSRLQTSSITSLGALLGILQNRLILLPTVFHILLHQLGRILALVLCP